MIYVNVCIQGGETVSNKKPKSFRFNEDDLKKLSIVHEYFKSRYELEVKGSNMDNLYKWSEAQTLAVLIRDRYEELLKNGNINIEK